MPTPALESMARKAGKSLDDAERYWREALDSAEDQGLVEGTDDFYAYAMGIVKRRMGLAGLLEVAGKDRVRFLRDRFVPTKVSVADFDRLVDADPTKGKAYLQWLIRLRTRNHPRLMEDLPRIHDDLKLFEKHKRSLPAPQRDINRIKSPSELFRLVEPFAETRTGGDIKREEREEMRSQIDVVYDGPHGLILIPKTEKASCYLGRSTRWCTAGDRDNEFEFYSKQGPLLVIVPAKPRSKGEKWQLHLWSGQLMDERDEPVDPKDIPRKLWHIVRAWIKDQGSAQHKRALRLSRGEALRLLPRRKYDMYAVRNDGWAIQFIRSPSEKIQLEAVRNAPRVIQFIKEPSEAVMLEAVRSDPKEALYVLRMDPPAAVKMAAIRKKPSSIAYMRQTEALQLDAVRLDPEGVVRWLDDPSPKVRDAYIKAVTRLWGGLMASHRSALRDVWGW